MAQQRAPGSGRSVGAMAPRDLDPTLLTEFARRAEDLGFDEVWVVDDLGFAGGLAQAAIALGATERVRIGVGILPAAVRNVAFTAMEVATLARAHPGRLHVGLGHGMPAWMRQVGVDEVGSVGLLEQHLTVLRSLLAGDEVDVDGPHVRLRRFRLQHPPEVVPEVFAGVRGPRSLAAAGRAADGTVLAEPVTPAYVASALGSIRPTSAHRIVGYNLAVVDTSATAARDHIRPSLAVVGEPDWAPHVRVMPFYDELIELRASSADAAAFISRLPDAWVDQLALVGDAVTVSRRISELHEAGVDSIVLIPAATTVEPLVQIERLAQALHESAHPTDSPQRR